MTPVLEVEDLTVDFGVEGRRIAALRGVNFAVNAGERVGIVGESGSGKSVTAQAIMRLLPKTAQINGTVRFGGEDVLSFNQHRLAEWRGAEIAMIFQDPMSSFNPLMRIGTQITETLRRHRGCPKRRRSPRPRNCWRALESPMPTGASKTIRTRSPAACANGSASRSPSAAPRL